MSTVTSEHYSAIQTRFSVLKAVTTSLRNPQVRIGKRVCKTHILLSNRERHKNLNVLYVIDLNDEVKRAWLYG